MIKNIAHGTGRRKTAVARVYLREGSAKVIVNGKEINEYFPIKEHVEAIIQPLVVTDTEKKFDILINVKGGGITGQAGACRHGLARALVQLDETNKPPLKAKGFMTRDARMVERKKFGRRGARRRFQFSKR